MRVLIVSRAGAHQKAIQVMCASFPQLTAIESVASLHQALEMIENHRYDVLILGATLAEDQVCELLERIKPLADPPYCIALTLSESGNCLDQYLGADQVVSTKSFANRLPEILDEVIAF